MSMFSIGQQEASFEDWAALLEESRVPVALKIQYHLSPKKYKQVAYFQ